MKARRRPALDHGNAYGLCCVFMLFFLVPSAYSQSQIDLEGLLLKQFPVRHCTYLRVDQGKLPEYLFKDVLTTLIEEKLSSEDIEELTKIYETQSSVQEIEPSGFEQIVLVDPAQLREVKQRELLLVDELIQPISDTTLDCRNYSFPIDSSNISYMFDLESGEVQTVVTDYFPIYKVPDGWDDIFYVLQPVVTRSGEYMILNWGTNKGTCCRSMMRTVLLKRAGKSYETVRIIHDWIN